MHVYLGLSLLAREARRLLSDTTMSVLDIGLAVGYASPSHFSQVFRESTGTAPSAWRGARQARS